MRIPVEAVQKLFEQAVQKANLASYAEQNGYELSLFKSLAKKIKEYSLLDVKEDSIKRLYDFAIEKNKNITGFNQNEVKHILAAYVLQRKSGAIPVLENARGDRRPLHKYWDDFLEQYMGEPAGDPLLPAPPQSKPNPYFLDSTWRLWFLTGGPLQVSEHLTHIDAEGKVVVKDTAPFEDLHGILSTMRTKYVTLNLMRKRPNGHWETDWYLMLYKGLGDRPEIMCGQMQRISRSQMISSRPVMLEYLSEGRELFDNQANILMPEEHKKRLVTAFLRHLPPQRLNVQDISGWKTLENYIIGLNNPHDKKNILGAREYDVFWMAEEGKFGEPSRLGRLIIEPGDSNFATFHHTGGHDRQDMFTGTFSIGTGCASFLLTCSITGEALMFNLHVGSTSNFTRLPGMALYADSNPFPAAAPIFLIDIRAQLSLSDLHTALSQYFSRFKLVKIKSPSVGDVIRDSQDLEQDGVSRIESLQGHWMCINKSDSQESGIVNITLMEIKGPHNVSFWSRSNRYSGGKARLFNNRLVLTFENESRLATLIAELPYRQAYHLEEILSFVFASSSSHAPRHGHGLMVRIPSSPLPEPTSLPIDSPVLAVMHKFPSEWEAFLRKIDLEK